MPAYRANNLVKLNTALEDCVHTAHIRFYVTTVSEYY